MIFIMLAKDKEKPTKANTSQGTKILGELKKKGIYAHPASWKVMAEEAPDAYKDVSEVVNVTHGVGISLKVAKLLPLGVVKG